MTLQQFLARRDIALSLVNDYGEAVYLGEAVTVKPLKDRHYLRFNGTLKESTHPYNKAVLHSGRNIYSVVDITPVRIDGTTGIELIA